MSDKYVIGVDYGTDSVRAIIVDAKKGYEIASSVSRFARWGEGWYCDASINEFRQHPLDYIEGLEYVFKHSLKKAGETVRYKKYQRNGSVFELINAEYQK